MRNDKYTKVLDRDALLVVYNCVNIALEAPVENQLAKLVMSEILEISKKILPKVQFPDSKKNRITLTKSQALAMSILFRTFYYQNAYSYVVMSQMLNEIDKKYT